MRKLLRSAGLALVLLPEPFTTPLGLALLGASYIFEHLRRVDTPAYLSGFIKMYLKEARLCGGAPGVIQHKLKQTLSDSEWRYRPAKDVRCGIDSSRLMLRFGKDMTIEFAEPATPIRHSVRQKWAGYVWPGAVRFPVDACGGSRKPVEKTVSHTMDIGRLSLRCDTATLAVEKAIRHSMKHELHGYVLPSVPVHAETAVVHTMNSDRLLHYYEKTMPTRFAVKPEPVVHAFNPAKVSLALGMG